jgi:hypothetical protein
MDSEKSWHEKRLYAFQLHDVLNMARTLSRPNNGEPEMGIHRHGLYRQASGQVQAPSESKSIVYVVDGHREYLYDVGS